MRRNNQFSKIKTATFSLLSVVLGLLFVFVIAEIVARYIEPEKKQEGKLTHIYHPQLGWVPEPGSISLVKTDEYTAKYSINSLGMNDTPIESSMKPETAIMALGDSHTFATGVNVLDVWPNVLEKRLFNDGYNAVTVYNLGVGGYNLGQYLIRMRSMEEKLNPQIVVIGFSMATDLYDLIPPERGGFVYGADKGRLYFDLDAKGRLIERNELVGKQFLPQNSERRFDILGILQNLALYRHFKRSNLAFWIATRFKPGGKSLWPGLDTALKIHLSDDDLYRWKLAEKILQQIATEAKEKGRKVVLVNIPYLAQVYDNVWNSSFGSMPDKYDRWIAGKRLSEICTKTGIYYVDTTERFVKEVRRKKTWLHYPKDNHPTVEGHEIIAESVFMALKQYNLL